MLTLSATFSIKDLRQIETKRDLFVLQSHGVIKLWMEQKLNHRNALF
jgi:hypothetical protein